MYIDNNGNLLIPKTVSSNSKSLPTNILTYIVIQLQEDYNKPDSVV